MKFSLYIIFYLSFIQIYAQESIFPNLTGNVLLDKLIEDFKPRTVLDYATAREYMYEELQSKKDSIEGVYSGFTIYLPSNEPSRAWTFDNGINAEHIYPRSKGASKGNAFSDLHHLRPARAAVNSARLNHSFKEINDARTKKWYRLDASRFDKPTDKIDEFSELDSFVTDNGFIIGDFEPRESVKGDIARAVFYFFTMYKSEALSADSGYFESMRKDLCHWHVQDSADENEIRFTKMIGDVQDGKVNPFIIDCSLALRSHCMDFNLKCADSSVPTVELSNNNELHIYPNPSDGIINFQLEKAIEHIDIYDLNGRLIFSNSGDNLTNVLLSQGLFQVVIRDKQSNVYYGRIVVN
ncbi:MAG: endonuclease [Saprospiraceae bacterium]